MNIRDKLMREARKSKLNVHRDECKRKRNEVNIMIRKNKSDYTRTFLLENSRNPDGFWAAIKRISFEGKKRKIRKIVTHGIKSIKPNKITDGFCNYFSTVVSILKQTSYPLIDFTWKKPQYLPLRTYKSFHFGYVSVIEVT